jgi:hypothetical protein
VVARPGARIEVGVPSAVVRNFPHDRGPARALTRLQQRAALLVAGLAPDRAALLEVPDQLGEETVRFQVTLGIVERFRLLEALLHARLHLLRFDARGRWRAVDLDGQIGV